MDHPELETFELTHPSVTSSHNVKPDILFQFEQEGFGTEPQESEERGNLTTTTTCEELHPTDDGFGNKRMKGCDGEQKEECKEKDPSRDSPDPSADSVGGISSVSLQENTPKGESLNICIEEERNSTNGPNLRQSQRISNESNLRIHERTHTGEKPNKCSEC
ncbi:zinc finger protein 572-like, partial [Microcaecilia unicolor]|uniref:Zinc finger protein 572-like n=1 Tax=Microcaecilia unicolor TaxID=1415580 RepID=A0A6P7WV46_9AMPH